ncbi:hypothetical protein Cni_G29452 [Canna indica]|uniref:Uncharacterized protein n=1 Tax=Canna indica TaxID=4628 RepID=A0AAQ3L7B4_9LILI|nr:hypothetical protein Cni_G29452 [Canna indica]
MPYNRLGGTLPGDIGKLRNLSSLSLRNNTLEARTSEDWEFLNSLAKCNSLQVLDLSYNKLEGLLPSSIIKLSTQLRLLGLAGNNIYGSIPADIGRSINLERLCLDHTSLTDASPPRVDLEEECPDCKDGSSPDYEVDGRENMTG